MLRVSLFVAQRPCCHQKSNRTSFEKHKSCNQAIVLSNISNITRLANDYGFESIFSNHISSLRQDKLIVFAISVSGKSPNILNLIEYSANKGLSVYGIFGANAPSSVADKCTAAFLLPSENFKVVEDLQMAICNQIVYNFETAMKSESHDS